MRLTVTKTASAETYYVIRSVKRDGKRSSEVVERLGTAEEIKAQHGCSDVLAWAKDYVEKLNQTESARQSKVLVAYDTNALIEKNMQIVFNVGYLFLQSIYCQLGIPAICRKIAEKHSFEYDLDSILSRLLYCRVLFPSSKMSCLHHSFSLLEQPKFDLHQIYRALSVLSVESDFIQAELYKNSRKVVSRQSGVLYYDCTNFFFAIDYPDGIKQYGVSKEHRPNPIVQMGMFMDKSGIPLAFCINPGNTNEQTTLQPLETQIIRDFELSKFVICTDAGLSSASNRKFNNISGRSFITTQSIKKLPKKLRSWCLSSNGWHIKDSDEIFDISELDETEDNINKIFYKQQFVEGYDEERDVEFNQTLIVTYSLKYRDYQRNIRRQQIEQAARKMNDDSAHIDKHNQNDYRRFIKKVSVTANGECADKNMYVLDEEKIAKEEIYDGFYAVYTNLDDDAETIINVNRNRWEIEESFRIMKTDFEARPVYLQREDRIKAHFMTCFMALMMYRILEQKLNEEYTCENIIETLRTMNVTKEKNAGYKPAYTRTDLTDRLHETFGFHTDYELITNRTMKGIVRKTKKN